MGDNESTQNDAASGDTDADGVSNGSACQITLVQADMLQQVNDARSKPHRCGDKDYSATAPLSWDCKLKLAALAHTTDMAENNFFSHTGSDGLDPGTRISAQGYSAVSWGENIAAGFSTIESVMIAWLESPGHCKNIMSPAFKDLGMARVQTSTSDFAMYWTQDFGASAVSNPAPADQPFIYTGQLSGEGVRRYPDKL
ncbi:MAG: CAP domain-containing protein [Pseudomonadota bacterium]